MLIFVLLRSSSFISQPAKMSASAIDLNHPTINGATEANPSPANTDQAQTTTVLHPTTTTVPTTGKLWPETLRCCTPCYTSDTITINPQLKVEIASEYAPEVKTFNIHDAFDPGQRTRLEAHREELVTTPPCSAVGLKMQVGVAADWTMEAFRNGITARPCAEHCTVVRAKGVKIGDLLDTMDAWKTQLAAKGGVVMELVAQVVVNWS